MSGIEPARPHPPRPAEVLLLRHAQTSWNDLHRRQGWSDQPLTEAGRRAAYKWVARAPSGFVAVCFSDLQRARETAAIIAAGLGVADRREMNALREQDQGAWTGLTKEQIQRRWPERLRERPRKPVGGESPEALLERVRAALASIAVAYRGARVLAITHNDVIRTLEFAMSLAAPPVPQLEGRWLRVQSPAEAAPEPSAFLAAGELTSGRATATGTTAGGLPGKDPHCWRVPEEPTLLNFGPAGRAGVWQAAAAARARLRGFTEMGPRRERNIE